VYPTVVRWDCYWRHSSRVTKHCWRRGTQRYPTGGRLCLNAANSYNAAYTNTNMRHEYVYCRQNTCSKQTNYHGCEKRRNWFQGNSYSARGGVLLEMHLMRGCKIGQSQVQTRRHHIINGTNLFRQIGSNFGPTLDVFCYSFIRTNLRRRRWIIILTAYSIKLYYLFAAVVVQPCMQQ
jgi:hypothetical protein